MYLDFRITSGIDNYPIYVTSTSKVQSVCFLESLPYIGICESNFYINIEMLVASYGSPKI